LSNVAVDVADAAGGLGRSGACSRAGRAGGCNRHGVAARRAGL
jgi:hypothetical protein